MAAEEVFLPLRHAWLCEQYGRVRAVVNFIAMW